MPNRDYDAARRERQAKIKPYTFTLGGETFTLKPTLPMGALWLGPPSPPERFLTETSAGTVFLNIACLIAQRIEEGDRDRWWSIFDHPDDPIEGEDLTTVLSDITEAMSGRPTSPSNGSSTGSSTEQESNGSNSNFALAERA